MLRKSVKVFSLCKGGENKTWKRVAERRYSVRMAVAPTLILMASETPKVLQ
jgi:hypothetical protein